MSDFDDIAREPLGGGADLRRTKRRRFAVDVAKIDRLPPHSIEAEQGVLGCCLLSPNDCIAECAEKFKAGQEVFYDLRHQVIYEVLLDMFRQRRPVDLITLQEVLQTKGKLEAVGGLSYISSLTDAIPSAANLSYYTRIVLKKYILRKVITVGTDTVGRAYEAGEEDAKEVLDQAIRDIQSVANEVYENKSKDIKSVVREAVAAIELAVLNREKGIPTGILTGFTDIDELVLGLHPGEFTVIGARPSVGKTALALNMTNRICIQDKHPTTYCSFEMLAPLLVTRIMAIQANTNLQQIRKGTIGPAAYPRLVSATGHISNAPIYIEDRGGMDILELRAIIHRHVTQYGVKVVFVDYLQLLHSKSRQAQSNRQVEISEISSGLKAATLDFNIAIVALAQLNRDVERGPKRKPRLSDLRESGTLEQDADNVWLMYRVDETEDDDASPNVENAEPYTVGINIPKQRNGPTDTKFIQFEPQTTTFRNLSTVHETT